jgi:CRP/FNR family transcriptional regulator, cyclic AMP receptor protein
MPGASFDTKAFLSKGGAGRKVLHFGNKQVIFSQGESGASVFYLQKGHVKLTVTSLGGREAVVALLGPKDFFGQECMAGQKTRIAGAVAMSDSVVTQIGRSTLARTVRREPVFNDVFVRYLLTHIIRVEGDLVDHLSNSSEKRLARTLLLISRFAKSGTPRTMHVPKVTHETLAEMVGTTRARINFFMNKFRKAGLIDYNGSLSINRSLLNVLLQD